MWQNMYEAVLCNWKCWNQRTQLLISNGPSMTPSLRVAPGPWWAESWINKQPDRSVDLKCLDSKRSPFDLIVLLK